MKILLDTHIALWAIADSAKLPVKATELISNTGNDIFISIASVWEVAIKHALHPDNLSISERDYVHYSLLTGFNILGLKVNHIFMLNTLKRPENAPKHNDPFDRIMTAQSRAERMIFITHDAFLPYYDYNRSEKFILFI